MLVLNPFNLEAQYQWLFLVPLIGGIGSIEPPQKARTMVYKWYVLPNGGIIYHLLREPEKTIDNSISWGPFQKISLPIREIVNISPTM